jgi:hypothetical protein
MEVGERELCVLVLVHPLTEETFELEAEAVWHKPDDPGAGVGFAILGLDAARLAALERFASSTTQVPETPPESSIDPTTPEPSRAAQGLYERLRGLSVRQRETMARQGTLAERVALERVWGGGVWEWLLQNPQLTASEVAQMAKNPGLPGTLVATITQNSGWMGKAEVQRALLQNPRVTGAQLERVLRSLPKSELARLPQQTNLRAPVKNLAKKILAG